MKRILITGAGGRIGRLLFDQLGDRYEVTATSRQPTDISTHVADLADLEAILPAFEGVDAIVHMGANAHVAAPWDEIVGPNVTGTYNVYEAARRCGVGQVIFASSNHAVSGWEIECGPSVYELADERTIDERAEIRPDSPYGFSKAAGEALGRQFVDLHGLRVHCLRIGWLLDAAGDADLFTQDVMGEVQPELGERDLKRRLRAIWLSHRDCVHLVDCCLRADHIPFGIYYGVSNNPRLFYDLGNARRDLGYDPVDSAPQDLGEEAGDR